ncbi:MAG: DUF87 domain-containing protein [Clostridia bacterium]|nr:DUF87 domain-containing protein [Clostridia bacterium]
MESFISKLNGNDKLFQLIQEENFVGWVYNIDYEKALVMTNDMWKETVNGIPHNSFLLATPFNPKNYGVIRDIDKQVILLRVTGSSKLPQDDDMIKMKIDNFQNQEEPFDTSGNREYDPLTKNKVQFGGLVCRVVGTFYMRNDNLVLGSDIETFYMSTKLNVFMPKGDALKAIVNYVDPMRAAKAKGEFSKLGITKEVEPFKIGTVRYTSTDRLNRNNPKDLVPFMIQPSDFLARRTAVLGMTRTGKSNMIKQTVSVVKKITDKCGLKIGQIIFDINGEYANANKQDDGSIADLYKGECVRYRMVNTPGFNPLLNNFYEQIEEGYSVICMFLKECGSKAADVQQFMNLSFDKPDEINEQKIWERKMALYKTILFVAGFEPPKDYKVSFEANKDVREIVNKEIENPFNPKDGITLKQAKYWFEVLRKNHKDPTVAKWITDECKVLLNMLCRKNDEDRFMNGYKFIVEAQKYHTPNRVDEVANEIYKYLCDGKIVIIDLSVGNATLRDTLSKKIASHIFNQSMKKFTDGDEPSNIVFYIEEAHNLIGKNMEITDTWPRLAKEGAKYKIALVYSTQEVSSVHSNILANTENWFVSHLNSEREMAELSKFYDFADFKQSLLRSQDVGFSRVKTLSSPFVIPIQIDKFDPKTIIEERKANV